MKKKLLSMFIAFVTAISMLSTSVYAANGPMGEITIGDESYFLAYINFWETDETGQILRDENGNTIGKTVFADDAVQNELAGAVYDRASNTLTITNLSAANMTMETNVMGDNFTLNVVGNCSIGHIIVWGDGYGGTLNIVGDGTLTVNQSKIFDNAIILNAEYSTSALKFGTGVKVNLYAKEDVAVVNQVQLDSADKVYSFANNQNLNIKKDLCKHETIKWIQGFEIVNLEDRGTWLSTVDKVEYCKDPTGIYGSNFSKYYNGDDELIAEGYRIIKLVYSDKYNAYFMDKTFGDKFGEFFIEKKDFEASDFKLVTDENGDQIQYENVYNNISSYQCYVDGSGKEYALGYDYNNGEEVKYAMDYELIEGIENTYAFTKNPSVNVSDLEPVYDITVEDGLYTYTLTGTTFAYDGSNISADKEIHLVDIGNVWTQLSADKVVPFTAEINPNELELMNQIELIDEIWTRTDDVNSVILLSKGKNNPKPMAGKTYSYSVTVKAKAGYVFGDSFQFVYGGSRYTPKVVLSADKKTATISGFIKDVTVKSTGNVEKAKQPMTAKGKTVKVKYKKLKKKKQTVKALNVKKAQGIVVYSKVKKGSSVKLTINKKTGKITVKKGTKKGTYKIKIKVTAKGNAKYLAGSKIITVKIIVR